MSQLTLKTPKPDDIISMDGSDAKNALPSKKVGKLSSMDIAGLSWIFLEDSWIYSNRI